MEKRVQQLKAKIKQRKKGERWKPLLKKEIISVANQLYREQKNWGKVANILEINQSDLYNLRAAQGSPKSKEEPAFAIAIIEEEEQLQEQSSSEITLKSSAPRLNF